MGRIRIRLHPHLRAFVKTCLPAGVVIFGQISDDGCPGRLDSDIIGTVIIRKRILVISWSSESRQRLP